MHWIKTKTRITLQGAHQTFKALRACQEAQDLVMHGHACPIGRPVACKDIGLKMHADSRSIEGCMLTHDLFRDAC